MSPRRTLALLLAALPATVALAIAIGSVRLPLVGIAGLEPLDPAHHTILWSVRLPRVLLAAVVGGGLAVVGATLQAVFRNPMADAGLLGVSSGAALGAVLAASAGWAADVFLALPAAAFGGALVALVLVYALAHVAGRPTLHGLLLTGLAVSALAGAALSMLLVATEEFRVKTVLFWLAGGLEGRSWPHLALGSGFVIAGCVLLFSLSRPLDLLSLGEDEAASLGLPVHAMRLLFFAAAALVAGAATAVAGSVPFVGLMAPHALRPWVGSLSRRLLPAAFLAGAALVVVADLGARSLSARYELPLGSVTAFVGAPYFLLAIRRGEERA